MLESAILSQLITNETYSRIVLPYIQPEYFAQPADRVVFETIRDFIQKYNTLPTIQSIQIDLSQNGKVNSQQLKADVDRVIASIDGEVLDQDWAVQTTEKFCQDRAIENALYKAVGILEDKEGKVDRGAIPGLLSDALAVSFDNSIGHDYMEDWVKRYQHMHTDFERIPFDIDYLNKITGGGLPRKTFTVILGAIGGGKSLTMSHMAASNLLMGKNVLYITMEMSEDQIAERIDANLLDTQINQLKSLPKSSYEKKIEKLRERTPGRLIIKEYPTASAGADNFRHLFHELKIKKKFVPDIFYVDYLNICKSSRVKMGASVNTYLYVKFIAEEIRGLAVEMNVPCVTGSQLNREGITSSDPSMEHMSDSMGTAMTADLIFCVFSNQELQLLNQMSIKQIKNRFNGLNQYNKFIIGCDRSKMKLYNVEQTAQQPSGPSTPAIFDSTPFGEKFDHKNIFKGFK